MGVSIYIMIPLIISWVQSHSLCRLFCLLWLLPLKLRHNQGAWWSQMLHWSKQKAVGRRLVGMGRGRDLWRDMSYHSFHFFFFFFLILGWGSCVWVKGTFFFFSWRWFFFFFFPKDQGQEESTPRVVGGKKNNKAHECLGTTTLLTSSIIISAWLGCPGNLHNTILTPSLQLSITTAVEFSFLAHACLLSVSPLVSLSRLPFFLLLLPLLLPFCMFIPLFLPLSMCACVYWVKQKRRGIKGRFHIISVVFVQLTDIQ